MTARNLTTFDRWLIAAQRGLDVALNPRPPHQRPTPDATGDTGDAPLSDLDRAHAAGLMRVNHAGEVAAQALYHGQASVATDPALRQQLLVAADEEQDHLAWCAQRLGELGSRPSRLGPFWYVGSYAIGVTAGLISDRVSLGFVSETERQVEEHLHGHLDRLPAGDQRSRAIVEQMKQDEAEHGQAARDAGGIELPRPVRWMMRGVARVMTTLAYWV
ncbi:2-polyprenyl-3-methyl-6-methoxy-1,4-benzoquinone monooxygenase [uncultured Abyssibacter sp.]|uniref:2-polyprenyl-3-methyl-6-methoxy-1,4-benzoquinone monooxygenase n=1 Tax=uncultured Abyssibacter sp. TaxID=2320202 RepID=UPI0032B100E8